MDWTHRLRLRNLKMLLSLAQTRNISHSAAMPVDAPIEQLDSWSSVDDAIRSSFEESAVESVALS